jgi:CheY-like chemotaxis protein
MDNIKLPYFQYIDTTIGLKYLNNDKKLYLKILNNFLNRYRDLKLDTLNSNEIKDIIHSIKGLASTLGMTNLSHLATLIHNKNRMDILSKFSQELSLVIEELRLELELPKIKTILLINDKIIDIDILIEIFDDKYDVIVALDESSALDVVESENISVVLLDATIANMDILKFYDKLTSKMLPVIFIVDNLDKQILKKISAKGCNNHIVKPFNIDRIEKCINLI